MSEFFQDVMEEMCKRIERALENGKMANGEELPGTAFAFMNALANGHPGALKLAKEFYS